MYVYEFIAAAQLIRLLQTIDRVVAKEGPHAPLPAARDDSALRREELENARNGRVGRVELEREELN